jgi:hypothetical protein
VDQVHARRTSGMGVGLGGIEARCGLVPSSMARRVDEDDRRRREAAGRVRDEEGRGGKGC